MAQVSVPRWSLVAVVMALVAALAFSFGAVYSARGAGHGTTYYACLYAGSLSQVGTTQPACGRGTMISWNQVGPQGAQGIQGPPGEAGKDGQDAVLDAALLKQIRCGEYPRPSIDLSACDLNGANLTGATLRYANLTGATLQYANLTNADLRYAYLTAFLQYANLTGADLRVADLRGANLLYADLRGADLRGADLRGAVLSYADLRGANLSGANLSGVLWSNTICPDGENSGTGSGATCIGKGI
jgi:uncharacterized protein YjbI with pentapeptide repeats